MNRRTAKAWLAAVSFMLAAMPARAEDWPQHGFFTVSSLVIHGGLKACEIQLSPKPEPSLSLVWVDVVGRAPLTVGYTSADPSAARAEHVTVGFDGVKAFSFTSMNGSVDPLGKSAIGPVQDAARAWEAMQQAAGKATWLTVKADNSSARASAEGLRDTLADLAECRRQRGL